ncbi:MAG: CooT family nickel-binding protein [Methanomassiliicoccus sp.]|nr:CooT family nickel-binding protein [Methanomassiliicoccus sp.]
MKHVLYSPGTDARYMCESTVFLEEGGKVREIMRDVTRIVMRDGDAVCTDILGEQMVLESVVLMEANLLSHGIVFVKVV